MPGIVETRVTSTYDEGDLNTLRSVLQGLGIHLTSEIESATVFRAEGITPEQAAQLAQLGLVNPVLQSAVIDGEVISPEKKRVEVGYKPGVTDPRRESLMMVAEMLGISPEAVSLSVEYGLPDEISEEDLDRLKKKLATQVKAVIEEKPGTLIFEGRSGPVEVVPITQLSDAELVDLAKKRKLFLELDEMQVIQKHFISLNREPTDVEIETLAQTWSEHCSHKTFKADLVTPEGEQIESLFSMLKGVSKKYFEKAEVATAFEDNAGGIYFYDNWIIVVKLESHNAPVALDPFGGADTKVGGVLRDIEGTGKGAVNILSIIINCFQPPTLPKEQLLPGTLHPQFLMNENSRGERNFGNKMGVPTGLLSTRFHPDFVKPVSLGGAVGLLHKENLQKDLPRKGDLVVTIGGKTGLDGLGGATFSSGAMTDKTHIDHATAVQIGNPIVQKAVFDALAAARAAGYVRTTTDCGAGGYGSAVGEIAKDIGVEVDLETVPVKYAGLKPYQKWLSESQERMVVVIAPEHREKFIEICKRYGAPADVIGVCTGDHKLTIKNGEETVGELSMDFLHNGMPKRKLKMEYPAPFEMEEVPELPQDWAGTLEKVLAHPTIASKKIMHDRYDQTVQGMSALAPYTGEPAETPNDASILTPLPNEPFGVVVSHALQPSITKIDAYKGAQWAMMEAMSRYVAAGGNWQQVSLVDNFVWPVPKGPHLYTLHQAMKGICEAADFLEAPFVSGKDSLGGSLTTSDGKRHDIPPVINITVMGKIPDVEKTVSADIKNTGSKLCLVGKLDTRGLGGSMYFETQKTENRFVPQTDMEHVLSVFDAVQSAIQNDQIRSCKAVGEGGFMTALSQMCFGNNCGAELSLDGIDAERPDFALFSETPGCFVVELAPDADPAELFGNVPYTVLGQTQEAKEITVKTQEEELFTADLGSLLNAWKQPMKESFS